MTFLHLLPGLWHELIAVSSYFHICMIFKVIVPYNTKNYECRIWATYPPANAQRAATVPRPNPKGVLPAKGWCRLVCSTSVLPHKNAPAATASRSTSTTLIRLMMFCSLLLTTTPARTQPQNHIRVKGKQKKCKKLHPSSITSLRREKNVEKQWWSVNDVHNVVTYQSNYKLLSPPHKLWQLLLTKDLSPNLFQ